jgi:hypothetical protein
MKTHISVGEEPAIHGNTLRCAERHNVTIGWWGGTLAVYCHGCGQQWQPMLQQYGRLPRRWWACPNGFGCYAR